MMRTQKYLLWAVVAAVLVLVFLSFWTKSRQQSRFRPIVIDADTTARLAVADIDGDGQLDLFAAVDFESGKQPGLYWYSYPSWVVHTVSEGINFRADDIECGDIDGDGDPDMVATVDEDGKVFWFENPGPAQDPSSVAWSSHRIGESGGYVKDVEIDDLDRDGRLEIVTRTHRTVNVFSRNRERRWTTVGITVPPKEGMDVGDLDGDGDLDIALNGFWLETPVDLIQGSWVQHVIDDKWYSQNEGVWQDNCSNVVVADFNCDGENDVVICHSEKAGWPIAWYENHSKHWAEHIITQRFKYCETLQVADMDVDGDLDVLAGEMKKCALSGDLVLFLNEGNGIDWAPESVFRRSGIYNAVVADIGGDGDPDIIGCRDYNRPPLEWQENLTADDEYWKYYSIDSHRPKSQFAKMGLVFTDVNADDYQDIVAGSYIYINPDGFLSGDWKRVSLGCDIDVYFAQDVDGDQYADLIGITGTQLLWLECSSLQGTQWHARTVGAVPEGRTQGYISAQVIPGDNPELVFTRGNRLCFVIIPRSNPENGFWSLVEISGENEEEEGVAAGDIDLDGDLDLATVGTDGHHVIWFENPEDARKDLWKRHVIGESANWLDRVAIADLNTDGRLDLIATEETQDWLYSAKILWFEGPLTSKTEVWKRHTIDTLRSVNSLDVADMNDDGYLDLIVAEHTDQKSEYGAPDNLTVVYQNRQKGSYWTPAVVERNGHSSHLGARVCDLDRDGDLDIVSIAWKQYKYVHLWENRARNKDFSHGSM